ncbi:MAG: hypothetical protein AB7T07_05150 [Steroidobacteraceae bacterium]
MSLLFRDVSMIAARYALVGSLVSGMAVTSALAADGYFIPEIELNAQHQSNPEMYSDNTSSATGYLANASGIFGLRSPRSVTELRPRVVYNEYSNRKDLRQVNEYADLNSQFTSLRGELNLIANYARENSYAAQRTSAVYDTFDPNDPTVDATGRISLISETRTRIQARPSFIYRFSERMGADIGAFYQAVNSNADSSGSTVDYRDVEGYGSLFWSWTPQTQFGAGVYGTKYQTDDGSDVTTGRGVSFQLDQKWSKTFSGMLAFNLEKTKVVHDDHVGALEEETFNSWGAEFNLRRKSQLGDLRFNLGRTFSPSSGGARTTLDQIRLQYYRSFKPRLAYLIAVRGFRNREQGVVAAASNNARDYATGYLQLTWDMTRTWYLTGGYAHYWQKYVVSEAKSQDRVFTLGIGYRGLGPAPVER